VCTTRFNIKNSAFCLLYIYMFHVVFRINHSYFPIQHLRIRYYNRAGVSVTVRIESLNIVYVRLSQGDSREPLITGQSIKICGGRSGAGTDSSPSTSVCPSHYHTTRSYFRCFTIRING